MHKTTEAPKTWGEDLESEQEAHIAATECCDEYCGDDCCFNVCCILFVTVYYGSMLTVGFWAITVTHGLSCAPVAIGVAGGSMITIAMLMLC